MKTVVMHERKRDDYACIQVSMTIVDKNVEDREYCAFAKVRDNYPQYLFTLDPLLQKRDGVTHMNLIDFLRNNSDL